MSWSLVTLVTALSLTQAAPRPDTPVQRGRKLFSDAGLGRSGQSCAHCHATVENEAADGDGLLRAGHSLFGVAGRASWRGDTRRSAFPTLRKALEACAELFQGATLASEDAARLTTYLESISPRRGAPPLVIQPSLAPDLDYDRDPYKSGDPGRGRALFFAACHTCHPQGAAGIGPTLRGRTIADLARAVREGNGLLRGNRKPERYAAFFGKDRLSDPELADVIAYVGTLER